MDKASYYLRRERHRLIILAVVSLALIGGALYLQVFQHEDPCPLCILQRYAYLLIAVFALAGAAARGWRGVRIAEVLILLAFGCGFDALEPVVDSLPLAKLLPSVFKVSGLCETLYPPIFGLLLPQWALLGFVLIFVLIARSLARHGQYQRA